MPVQQVKACPFPVHISYFLQKSKKGKSQKMDLPLMETISQPIETLPKLKIHCRKYKFRIDDFKRESQPVIELVCASDKRQESTPSAEGLLNQADIGD